MPFVPKVLVATSDDDVASVPEMAWRNEFMSTVRKKDTRRTSSFGASTQSSRKIS